MREKRAVIVGAGLGGLSCGIHLAARGFEVRILEQNSHAGGRAAVLREHGYVIDMGPTLLLMPEILEAVFGAAEKKLEDYLTLKKIEPGYRIHYADGRTFDMTTVRTKLIEEIRRFHPGGEAAFGRYARDVEEKFNSSRGTFIDKNIASIRDLMTLESLAGFFKIRPFGTSWDHVHSYFKEDHLAAAFSCQTLYLGESPFNTPSLYNLLAYLEFSRGIYYPEGGMGEIPRALERLFKELGGTIETNAQVVEILIEQGAVSGVRLKDGRTERCSIVVSNRDIGSSLLDLVGEKSRPSSRDARIAGWRYGQSCVLYYLGLKKKIPGIFHHNILLSPDFRESCREIFKMNKLPQDPLLYVCVPTKTDAGLAPEGGEVVYILALAPNLAGSVDWDAELPYFRRRVWNRLAEAGIGIEESGVDFEKIFTPRDFAARYGARFGNAFGLAPYFFQSACFRPPIRSKDVSGLYHAGASTHPGTGIPMVLTSGRLAAEEAARDFGD